MDDTNESEVRDLGPGQFSRMFWEIRIPKLSEAPFMSVICGDMFHRVDKRNEAPARSKIYGSPRAWGTDEI
ncbi:unnamed protein product [Ceutorhynchus assimilis]|uniref:Uncharacterized protein n=1 Tax=Ceutorhynchus assimilis TaxID=467358 RepID=A0A9N9QEW4_9CUCU|nr:unnamed protein product [Ceutorhynchus assimilis]